jgi:hypothetical protein
MPENKNEGAIIPEGGMTEVILPTGERGLATREQLPVAIEMGARVATEAEISAGRREQIEADIREESFGGVRGALAVGIEGAASGATLGGTRALAGLAGGDEVTAAIRAGREARPLASTLGEFAGMVLPTLATGGALGATRLGRALAATPAGAAAVTGRAISARGGVAAAGAGLAAEGAFIGAGQALGEMAISEDDLSIEQIAAGLGKGALFGAAVGGTAGFATKAAGKAIGRLREGRRAAASAVPPGEEVVSGVNALRSSMKKVGNLYTLTKDAAKGSARAEASGMLKNSGNALRKLSDLPESFAKAPWKAREALERQSQALQRLADEAPSIRKTLAAEGRLGGARAKALDALPDLQQRNAALREMVEGASEAAKATKTSFGQQIAQQQLGGAVAGMFAGGPLGAVAGMFAPKLAGKIVDDLAAKLGRAGSEVSQRVNVAIDGALAATAAGARAASRASTPLATKVLAETRLAPPTDRPPGRPPRRRESETLTAFRDRAHEIRAQVGAGPTGRPQVTPRARDQIARQLEPIAAVSPVLADRIEATQARKLEYLAAALPKSPGLGMQIGRDTWRPSDFEIAAFARKVAAVEDPASVIERVADGSLTPEDAEALRSVYPELFADMRRQIVERLPELREGLPYQRRLMLSIFFGVPVDPAMEPSVLGILQGHFSREESSAGGTAAPMPQPNFGSLGTLAKEDPTPAQERADG